MIVIVQQSRVRRRSASARLGVGSVCLGTRDRQVAVQGDRFQPSPKLSQASSRHELLETNRRCSLVQGKLVAASMHDPKSIELEIVQSVPHRGRELRGIGAFDFEAEALLAPNHKEIEFGAAVGAPEKAFVGMTRVLEIEPCLRALVGRENLL
jgi:hypothetical protein